MSEANIFGLLGYFSLNLQQRLAKDASLCPEVKQEVALAEMSAQSWQNYCVVAQRAQAKNINLQEEMGQCLGLMQQLEERLRPGDWYERLMKSYVILGAMGQFNAILVEALPEAERAHFVQGIRWDCHQVEWAKPLLAQLAADHATIASRLSLWGRRVLGDVISMVRTAALAFPDMFVDSDLVIEELIEQLNQGHRERMTEVGLRA